MALTVQGPPRLPFSEAGFELNPVDVMSPVRNDHFSLQKCMVMQPDINLMHTSQKLCYLSVLHLCAFWKGQWLSSACIDLQTDIKASGNFLFNIF